MYAETTRMKRMLALARDYRVIPLSADHLDDAAMLGGILRDRPAVVADPKRDGFYWVEMDRCRFYVNVHDATRTVYLISVENCASSEPLVHSEAAS